MPMSTLSSVSLRRRPSPTRKRLKQKQPEQPSQEEEGMDLHPLQDPVELTVTVKDRYPLLQLVHTEQEAIGTVAVHQGQLQDHNILLHLFPLQESWMDHQHREWTVPMALRGSPLILLLVHLVWDRIIIRDIIQVNNHLHLNIIHMDLLLHIIYRDHHQ